MQFRGHSLPVRQSMSVPWEFFTSFHFISQFPPTRFPLITTTKMCHFLPVHHLGMAFLAGFEGQNITPTRSDNTVSVSQGGTATPGATKQLVPPDRAFNIYIYIYIYIYIFIYIYIYIYIYARSTKRRNYI